MVALTAQGFLEKRLKRCNNKIVSLTDRKNTILTLIPLATNRVLHTRLNHLLKCLLSTVRELRVLQNNMKTLEEDLTVGVHAGTSESFSAVFTSKLLPEILDPIDRDLAVFKERIFRDRALDFYNASKRVYPSTRTFCNLLGWGSACLVKTMRIVPASMACPELGTVFGVSEIDLYSPRNGINLLTQVARYMRKGTVVFLPVDEAMESWKLVLVDEDRARDICITFPSASANSNSRTLRLDHITGKELITPTALRPATRFLLFRFVMTYLIAWDKGHASFLEKIDNDYAFIWTEIGKYLRRSTVAALAWNFGGFIIPGVSGSIRPLENVPGENADRDGAVLAALLNRTIAESEWERVEEGERYEGYEDYDEGYHEGYHEGYDEDEPEVEEVEDIAAEDWDNYEDEG